MIQEYCKWEMRMEMRMEMWMEMRMEMRNEKCKCSISLKSRHIELWINKKRLFNELPN